MAQEKECHQCAGLFRIDDDGVARHVDCDGEIDYEADADHVPYSLDDVIVPPKGG